MIFVLHIRLVLHGFSTSNNHLIMDGSGTSVFVQLYRVLIYRTLLCIRPASQGFNLSDIAYILNVFSVFSSDHFLQLPKVFTFSLLLNNTGSDRWTICLAGRKPSQPWHCCLVVTGKKSLI